MENSPPQKCLRCSQVIGDGDFVVFQHGDLIHVRCWQVIASADHVRQSRLLAERSREQLEESRKRVARVWEALGSNAGIVCVFCRFPVSRADLAFAKAGLAHRACSSMHSAGDTRPTTDR